jgi:hypothetical protein
VIYRVSHNYSAKKENLLQANHQRRGLRMQNMDRNRDFYEYSWQQRINEHGIDDPTVCKVHNFVNAT